VRSDFNGDGMRDLAIGAPTANVGGEVLAGEVHVLYGGAMGLTATGAQRFSLDTPLVPGDPERGQFGTALASGDFDGDGYADLAVGAPLQRVGDYDGAGSITVIPGSPSGLTARGSRTWTENANGLPVSAGWEDQFGEALAAGDCGRGPQDDLAVGAPFRRVSGRREAGGVIVLYGGTEGLRLGGSQLLTENSLGLPEQAGDLPGGFGDVLVAGNVGKGPGDDLAIGVPTASTAAGRLHDGEVVVLYGRAQGLTSMGVQVWTEDKLGVTGGGASGDQFGSDLAIGNFGHSPVGDLAIGVPGRRSGAGQKRAGAVQVLFGGPGGLTTMARRAFTQTNTGLGTSEGEDLFGVSLTAGDFGHGPEEDLAVGVPGESIGPNDGAGVVDVVYGSPEGITFVGAQGITQASLGLGAIEPDFFGGAILAANFGNGPTDDLAIGVPGQTVGSAHLAGVVDIGFGSPDGITATGAEEWSEKNDGAGGAAREYDSFGSALG